MSIRTKLTTFISLLLVMFDAIICLQLYLNAKKAQEERIRELGTSFISLLSHDNEVRYAIRQAQPALLAIPLKRIEIADRGGEIGYWRISDEQTIIIEHTVSGINTRISEISAEKPESPDTPLIRYFTTNTGETFYDFTASVSDFSLFSEEELAAQVLDDVTPKTERGTLGFVQIGLTTRRLYENVHRHVLYNVIPLGIEVALIGIAIALFLTRYLISPIRSLANVTRDIAQGNLSLRVSIRSGDEIGQLSTNFNDMTRSLEKYYGDLKEEVAGHRQTEALLQHRLEMEGLIAAVSSSFVICPPDKVDDEINLALEMIGKFSNADRSYVFCFAVDAEKKVVNNTHEWCAEGIRPEIGNLQGIEAENLPWSMERLERFETIHVPRVVDMPPDAHAEKALLQAQSIQSLVIVPMAYSGDLVGFLGFDSVRTEKIWDNNDILLLKLVGEIFVNALEHGRKAELLQMSENKYRTLLENLPQRIFYKDRHSVYVSCNQNYARDLSITPGEIAGKTDCDFYPRELAEKYRMDDRRILASGQVEDIEEKYIVKGREKFVHTVKTPVRNEQGDIIGILGIFWDITDKVALQMEALRARHLASLGELSAGVAHEINNPVNGIINYAQVLLNRKGRDNKERDMLFRIIKEGHRAAEIVRNLLSFARPTDAHEKKVLVRVHSVISDILALIGAQLRKRGITTALNVPEALPAILAHPQRLQQVFLNLMDNAQYALCEKYPASHADKIMEITGGTVTIDDVLYVKVIFCDHGTGISPDVVSKIMDPFFTTKPRNQGTGLGLSICHSIISEHGGRLSVESEEGVYTRVSVLLPAAS